MGVTQSTEPASWDGEVLALQQVTALLQETQSKIEETKRVYIDTPSEATASRVLHSNTLLSLVNQLVSLQCEQEALRTTACVRK